MTTASLIKVGAVFIFAGLAMSGCSASISPTPTSSAPSSPTIDVPDNMQEQAAETLKFAQTLLGMAQAYAENKIEEAGYEHRMVWKDGESFVVTEDYRPTRINLYIKEGIVDKVEVG
jgi:hypothetical protein